MFKSQTLLHMPEEAYYYFLRTKEVLHIIPHATSPVISCHIVCRIVSKYVGIPFVDGYFNGKIEHSWLVIKEDYIIDAYPIGLLEAPIIVDTRVPTLPWKSLYKPSPLKIVTTEDFQEDLRTYMELLEKEKEL